MRGIISRFAPAPTGYLHLGHVLNADYVWGETRARSGRVLLRIEDHDRQRSRRQFEEAILEDLAWLGFEADQTLVRQSERDSIYEDALDRLRQLGLVYACDCSRAQIAHATAGLKACATTEGADAADVAGVSPGVVQPFRPADPEVCYPGTCATRGLAEGPGVGLRVRLEPSVERFVDLRLGPQEQRPSEQCGDLLVRDRDGNWTYQFAATVDDFVQGVTLVIRGVDLLDSTGRQIQLARLLGRSDPPAFLHHPLIMKSPAQKLSKSDRDTGIRELRARGWTPRRVIEHARSLVE
jgi:glutamyl-tRNA synthetase/glutamyl-Q tRNA(Asp) synthetase